MRGKLKFVTSLSFVYRQIDTNIRDRTNKPHHRTLTKFPSIDLNVIKLACMIYHHIILIY